MNPVLGSRITRDLIPTVMTVRTVMTKWKSESPPPESAGSMAKKTSMRTTASFRIDRTLLAEFSDFVRNQAGTPLFCTKSSVLESAIRRELERLRFELSTGSTRSEIAADSNHRKV